MSGIQRGLLTIGLSVVAFGVWVAYIVNHVPAGLIPDYSASQPGFGVKAVLIDNVRLISMQPGSPAVEEARAVLVIDGQIEAIGAAGQLAPPKGAHIIDGAGKTLIPGLIDAHIHLWDEAELAGYLAHGVTGVRNMSGFPFHVPLGARIASGEILGPDFLTTGPILNSHGPNQQLNHQLVDTAEEARAAVQQQYRTGYRALKLYPNLRREAYDAILEEAARLHLTITGHTPEGVRGADIPYEFPFDIGFEESLGRGFRTIEHVESIVWHGLRDQLDEEAVHALAIKIAAAGQVVTPTLVAHDNLVRVAVSKGAYAERPGVETINPLLRLFEKDHYAFWAGQDPAAREGPRAEFYQKVTKILYDAGVPVIAGTDAGIFTNIPGSSLTRELELLVKAGLTPYQALASATVVSAQALGFEQTGVIAPGYRAHLVLVSGDPLTDIGVVETPDAVMVHGRWLNEQVLDVLRETASDTSLLRSAWRAMMMRLSV